MGVYEAMLFNKTSSNRTYSLHAAVTRSTVPVSGHRLFPACARRAGRVCPSAAAATVAAPSLPRSGRRTEHQSGYTGSTRQRAVDIAVSESVKGAVSKASAT